MLQDSVINATGHHSFAYLLMGFRGLFPPYLNYYYIRPVSLTSIVCKTLERIIVGMLITHIKENQLGG